jgi:3,4-dihydroxy 2-butanone 4-phosphate synthase/GTP cyclohydrolase II
MKEIQLKRLTCARVPTAEGTFEFCLYSNNQDDKEHFSLHTGDLQGASDVLMRIHSECLTGDLLGSQRCDCGPQLHMAMRKISEEGRGLIVYLRQEGRGIGLNDKLRAYNLQDEGFDTIEANLLLGHDADERDYSLAAAIINDFGIRSVQMMTNNLDKLRSLEDCGVHISARIPLESEWTDENEKYLRTKADRMNHQLHLDTAPRSKPRSSSKSNHVRSS